ncbi:unnamed protein product [Pleuronectes platessa]|uniref:Uncharacterized protein n=1 Tax=Pleuronectes platessa TaxID=8262 RepID=A0A9N7UNT3_PLEPL|nr:unnamed protein product [Pleuronectes platessa]
MALWLGPLRVRLFGGAVHTASYILSPGALRNCDSCDDYSGCRIVTCSHACESDYGLRLPAVHGAALGVAASCRTLRLHGCSMCTAHVAYLGLGSVLVGDDSHSASFVPATTNRYTRCAHRCHAATVLADRGCWGSGVVFVI